jgi:hypothetical protein
MARRCALAWSRQAIFLRSMLSLPCAMLLNNFVRDSGPFRSLSSVRRPSSRFQRFPCQATTLAELTSEWEELMGQLDGA